MSGGDFYDWLGSITLTKPFTLDDVRELYRMIHNALVPQNVKIDVYTTRGDVVHVRVETERGVLQRDIEVV